MKIITKLMMTIGLTLIASVAFAHPQHSTSIHSDFVNGLLHPMMGLDHLLAMAAIGFWSIRQGAAMKRSAPILVVIGMLSGAFIAWGGISIVGAEVGIAMSVLLLGILIATMTKLPSIIGAALVIMFMTSHGYAHGAEMAHGASVLAYMTGFTVTTLAITFIGRYLGNLTLKTSNSVTRCLGGIVAAIGLVLAAA